jgi:hypothetical protein
MDYVWNDGLFEIFEKSVLSSELVDYRAKLYIICRENPLIDAERRRWVVHLTLLLVS